MDNKDDNRIDFRKKMFSKFFLYGMVLKNDAFSLLENEYLNGYPPYENLDQFIKLIQHILINKLPSDNLIIDKEFTEGSILKVLRSIRKEGPIISHDLVVRNCSEIAMNARDSHKLHFEFLRSLCNKFVDYLENADNTFEIKQLSSVINTYRATLSCCVFGFLRKNLSKINEYILEDETGSCVIEFHENTERRNCIILENSFVLIDGTFHSLANSILVNKIGYLPSKLCLELNEDNNDNNDQQIQNLQSNMFIIIKDVYLDERAILEKLKILFTAYNSVIPLPHFFIFIGPFTRDPELDNKRLKELFQFFFRIILTCPKISENSKIIIVPGVNENHDTQDLNFVKSPLFQNSDFILNNLDVNFTSNPCNLYVNDKHICILSSNYFKLVKKHILFRKKTTDEEYYNEFCNIMLSNYYLLPGLSKNYLNSMNIFHYPDLIILADNTIITKEISFKLINRTWIINLNSFSKENFRFKVFYSDSNTLEESQMNS